MLSAYVVDQGVLCRRQVGQLSDLTADVRWLEVNNPTEQERQWVLQAYKQELQFIEELGEIEASARQYRDAQGFHVHLYFLRTMGVVSRNLDVAFTINNGRLFTLCATEVPEFRSYVSYAAEHPELRDEAMCIFLGIVSVRLGLLADQYEKLQVEMDTVASAIFRGNDQAISRVLETMARIEDINRKARLGLIEHQRVFTNVLRSTEATDHSESITDILRDVESLVTHSNFLFERTKFIMDTAMGMININHSKRLNIFTVLSVVLMPPMLITSIYGMNFEHIPELRWLLGYPFALILVIASAAGPILYLKHKGWM
jgi:magnesium transporter